MHSSRSTTSTALAELFTTLSDLLRPRCYDSDFITADFAPTFYPLPTPRSISQWTRGGQDRGPIRPTTLSYRSLSQR